MSLLNCRINQHQFGDPKESLKYESVSLEVLGQGKVRVEVEATNINPSDLLSIYGVGQYKNNHVPPRVPGFEAVGRVRQSHSSEFLEGDRVVVATSGTWQRYIDVEPNNLFHVPEHLEAGFASQLYINSLTAWVLTHEVAALTNDDCLIINAGNSAIGKIFAQLSQSLVFTLIVVTSSQIGTGTRPLMLFTLTKILLSRFEGWVLRYLTLRLMQSVVQQEKSYLIP